MSLFCTSGGKLIKLPAKDVGVMWSVMRVLLFLPVARERAAARQG